MLPLPIDPILPEALSKLRQSGALVLTAEPGAGKTTRLPPAILRSGLLSAEHPNLLLLQPRRVAARAAAARIAEEHHWQLGRQVGYQIRFERKISSETRLHVMTEGILTRRLLDDPILEGVGCVILDEFHERSLHTDLAIAMLREIRQTVRPDLLIVVMSATLEAEQACRFLENAPLVRVQGRTFPVEIEHTGAVDRRDLPARIAGIVSSLDPHSGDVLVFLPGVGEINRAIESLESLPGRDDLLVIPLHGSLPADEQFRALHPAPRGMRKIVVATNIAETSLTIDGVRTVIDSGWARIAMFDPRRGMDRLELQRISRASSTQRAGRAGRTAPGRCIRLWSAIEDKNLQAFEIPEVRRVDLTATILQLHAWGHSDARKFNWYEPPDEPAILSAERLLEMLGATTSETGGKITDVGQKLLALPVHPRLGRLLLTAAEQGIIHQGAAIAALLWEKDILRLRGDVHPSQRRPNTQGPSDLLIRLDCLESRQRDDAQVDRGALQQVLKAQDELERIASRLDRGTGHRPVFSDIRPQISDTGRQPVPPLDRLPLWAYPDRVCRRRENDPSAGVMVGGSGVRLAPESVVRQAEFFVALDARQDQRSLAREAIVHIAHAIDPAWLEEMFPQEIHHQQRAIYDEHRDRVVGSESVLYRDLVLRQHSDSAVDDPAAQQVLMEWALPRAWDILRDHEPAKAWLARLHLLRLTMPEKGWPAIDPEMARRIIESAAAGKRSMQAVRAALLPALRGLLVYPLDRIMETDAPETIEVPTGNHIKLAYSDQLDSMETKPPVLAVRLQEMFGLRDTPRIAGGRVRVQLHLLGPNFRPVQITDDLASFWRTTYFQVRKDLRVRYPKHAWPEDPLTAPPQAKGSRRR
jgi:ATP-dependent helicase HrpB